MKNKYYTPDISEFNTDLEFELLNNINIFHIPTLEIGKWVNCKMEFGILGDILNIQKLILDKQIRVKFLDREDIESLGWNFVGDKDNNRFHFNDEDIDKSVLIHETGVISVSTRRTRFSGYLKNKSELKKIMVQLGV